MNEITLELKRPFGPCILEVTCPKNLIENINHLIDNMSDEELEKCSSRYTQNPKFPNLLNRGFEIIYFLKEHVNELRLEEFILQMSKEYLHCLGRDSSSVYMPNPVWSNEHSDIWVNRYFRGDITPPHGHAHYISGVIILKLPENIPEDMDLGERPDRSLEFNHNDEYYLPAQEVGKMYLFPSCLRHWVHFHMSDEERRTISFNVGT
jgi:hypothetical protein